MDCDFDDPYFTPEQKRQLDRIAFIRNQSINPEMIKSLYEDAGWVSYTKSMPILTKAIEQSLRVISAWDEQRLVGLIRVVGDGLTIVYIQDLLVLQRYRRLGIGSNLLRMITDEFAHVMQTVLLTDNQELTNAFYQKNGFFVVQQKNLIAYAKM